MDRLTLFSICVILPACWTKAPEYHSLHYVYTALSKSISAPGIFEFTAMGILDGRKIDYYNSRDKVKIPEQTWMEKNLPEDYWEKGTASRKSKEQWFKVNVNILMERMKQNDSDVHSLMWRHGCDAVKMPDGSLKFVSGVDQYSYDGMDFLAFDDASQQWVAPVPEAVVTKKKWDDVPALNQYTKGYLEQECVQWLEKFRSYSNEASEDNLKDRPPEVHLFAKNGRPQGQYLLTCLATGFYPKDITVSILKNDWREKDSHMEDVLPNGDGTHQIRLTTVAEKEHIHMYRCEVTHRTLDKPIILEWKTVGKPPPEEDFSPTPIVIGALLAVVLIGVVVGMIAFAKTQQKLCFAPPAAVHVPVNGAEVVPLNKGEAQNGTERKDSIDTGKGSTADGSADGSSEEIQNEMTSALDYKPGNAAMS